MEKIVDVELSALIGPADCGGPFDLWEPNSTFNSPNYPQSYGNKAKCEYTLNFCSFGVRDSANSTLKIGRRCDWPRSCAFLNACAIWLYNYSDLLSLQVCGPSTPQKDESSGCTSWILTWKPPTTWWRCGIGRGQTPRCWVRIWFSFISSPSWWKFITALLPLQMSSPEAKAPPGTSTRQPARWRSGSSQTPQAVGEDSGPTSRRGSTWAHLVLELGRCLNCSLSAAVMCRCSFSANSSVCKRRVPVFHRKLYPR